VLFVLLISGVAVWLLAFHGGRGGVHIFYGSRRLVGGLPGASHALSSKSTNQKTKPHT
jgi:hypothetical protein